MSHSDGRRLEAAVEVLAPEKVPNERPRCLPNLLLFLVAQRPRFRHLTAPPTSSRSLKKRKALRGRAGDYERRREEIHGATFSADKSTRQKALRLELEHSGMQER